MTRVLVIGASRGIGLETVKQALAAGHEVRAFARHASGIASSDPRLEKIDGDALDRTAIDKAVRGVDAVVQVLGVTPSFEMVFSGTRLFSEATRVLVPAMEGAAVKRLVCVTGYGAGDSRGRGSFIYNAAFYAFLGRVYADKDIQEQIIRRSSLDWTIARPTILTSGARSGRYRVLVEPSEWATGSIARADVADFLVKQITDTRLFGKTPCLTA
jgi:putative NADH-flavin reductase